MKFRLSSEFGEMAEIRGNIPHKGIDLAMPEGTQLRSLFDGTVEKVFNGGNIGNGVSIRTEDGANIIYGHMKHVDVHVGDKLSSGELIGLSGNTGNSSGPHLHFGYKNEHGEFVDPTKYADDIANMSGSDVEQLSGFASIFQSTTPLGDIVIHNIKENIAEGKGAARDAITEKAADMTKDITMGILEGLGDILVETIGAITLVGSAVLIILKLSGFDAGFKWVGILNVSNIIIKAVAMGVGR